MLFGCYRKGDANDPETYTAAIAAVLAMFPEAVILRATDPRVGLPSLCDFLPTPKEVKDFCEKEMAPVRAAEAREARIAKQFADREEAEIDRSDRPTYEELIERCARDGLIIGKRRAIDHATPAENILEKYGISKEDWDAVPSAPPRREP